MNGRESYALSKMGQQLASVFDPCDLEAAKETMLRCLTATRTQRVGRDAGGHLIYEEIPDYPIQLAASAKVIEWTIGKPVSRSVVATVSSQSDAEPEHDPGKFLLSMLADPQAAETVSRIIEIAKKSRPVDVTTVQEVAKEAPPTS